MTAYDGSERRKENQDTNIILVRIDEKLANLIETFKGHKKESDTNFEKHDARLTKIENFHMKAVGGLVIISIILQLLFKFDFAISNAQAKGDSKWQQTQTQITQTPQKIQSQ